jgi:hypothetical protein
MRKYLFLLFIVFSTIIPEKNLQASHFAGADLTYVCLGGNIYLLSLTFYRDCSGISAPTNANIQLSCSSNSSLNFSTTLNKIPGTGQLVSLNCSAVTSTCSGGTAYGIQEYVYQAIVTLQACNSWTMSYSSCCRNPITTVPNNSYNDWYVTAMLNNLDAPCNSSPSFTNKPPLVACVNQPFCFSNGVIEPNGDSLAYSFYAPYKAAGQSITYSSPYSDSNFLSSSTPISLDPTTGDICFTASSSLITATGLKVEEWRSINGVPTHIGTIYRDIQLKTDVCNNKIPTLSGMDTLNTHTYSPNDTTYQIEMCLGPTLDFDINGFDQDTFNPALTGRPDIYKITWNQGIPQGTFTTHFNGTDSAYAHFNWTPTSADISNNPRCFTVSIHDEACPYYGKQTFSYCITIRGMLVDIGPSDSLLCHGESAMFYANADTTTVNYIWKWNGNIINAPMNQDSMIVNTATYPPGLDTLSIETNDGNITLACPGRDFVIINNIYQPHIAGTLPDSAFCGNFPLFYDAGSGKNYLWLDANLNCLGFNQTQSFDKTGTYSVFVDGGNNTRCHDRDTFTLTQLPPMPLFSLGKDTTISPGATLLLQLPLGYTYHWNTGHTTPSLLIDNNYFWKNEIIGSIIDTNQCILSDTIFVFIGTPGFGELDAERVQLMPNPVKDKYELKFDKAWKNARIELYDMHGQHIHSDVFTGKSYTGTLSPELPAGSYFVLIHSKEGRAKVQLIKQ